MRCRLMSTPSGIDKVLMTVSYMLQVLTPNLPRGSLLISSFRSLTSLISDIRIFHRLWGLLGIYSWGHSLLQHPPRDLTIRRIVAAQVLANACFQVFENVAYLASHQVVRLGKKGQGRLWVWSSRFWMAHVGLEFWRLQRVRELRMQKVSRGLLGRGDEEEEERWKREVISNCAYAPLTVCSFLALKFRDGYGAVMRCDADCDSLAALVRQEWHDWSVSSGCSGECCGSHWASERVAGDGVKFVGLFMNWFGGGGKGHSLHVQGVFFVHFLFIFCCVYVFFTREVVFYMYIVTR